MSNLYPLEFSFMPSEEVMEKLIRKMITIKTENQMETKELPHKDSYFRKMLKENISSIMKDDERSRTKKRRQKS